jgi:FkbH-like protein
VLAELKRRFASGRPEEAAELLRRAALPTLDYTAASSLSRLRARLRAPERPAGLRLAVASSFTASQLCQLVDLFLFRAGIEVELYEAEYGVFRQEILDPGSALYAFRPQIVFLATSRRDLAHVPALHDSAEAVAERVRAELADWSLLWRTLHERLGCLVIQNNFEAPAWRVLGNHELRHPAGTSRFVSLVNHAFADYAPDHVVLHDVDALSAAQGRERWGDERFYHQAKLPCAPECLVDYAHSAASLVAAQSGKSRKCLALDLDNTLWGGVIGDDGLGGIRLGQGEPDAEAFQSFQRYCKALRERGVILAVCSKNEEAVAREAFEKHTEMVLRLEDIACFVANWEDKASNLRSIAERLEIGLDSIVFVDDNPAERALVRRFAPAVAVPEMPEDAAGFVAALERHRYFQPVALSGEDLRRTDYYRANAARSAAQTAAGDLEGFLRSLEMVARVEPVHDGNLARVAQLVSRSNQFNLTTRRHSAAQLAAMAADAKWLTRTVSLGDRFGDNGLISVLLAQREGGVLSIDTWLMSCRVLKRGVERFLLDHLYRLALAEGIGVLRGEYLPTPKNALVRDHYRDLGFERVAGDEAGPSTWELAVREAWQPRQTAIRESESHG